MLHLIKGRKASVFARQSISYTVHFYHPVPLPLDSQIQIQPHNRCDNPPILAEENEDKMGFQAQVNSNWTTAAKSLSHSSIQFRYGFQLLINLPRLVLFLVPE